MFKTLKLVAVSELQTNCYISIISGIVMDLLLVEIMLFFLFKLMNCKSIITLLSHVPVAQW